jgi:hypothetical protein
MHLFIPFHVVKKTVNCKLKIPNPRSVLLDILGLKKVTHLVAECNGLRTEHAIACYSIVDHLAHNFIFKSHDLSNLQRLLTHNLLFFFLQHLIFKLFQLFIVLFLEESTLLPD